jgi:mitochondrial fission protein ELM1
MKTLHSRPTGYRLSPEKIVLGPTHNSSASHKAPVRIYVGTETAQARAERIFVWSIDLVRDPSRRYEIYLMKELTGFDRRRWLTGFTNYRFAIPDFAGGSGRAIYNDVDQIYLTDPGELFDLDLNEHGFLTIAENDSSVMLLDCAKMRSVWSIDRARHERKSALLKNALETKNLWGRLEPEWNARDEEYVSGKSKVLHYTALHTQPWHPFPHQFVYQESPVGKVWEDLEHRANSDGFQMFSRTQPSSQFAQLVQMVSEKKVTLDFPSGFSQIEPDTLDLHPFISSMNNPSLLHYQIEPSQDFSPENNTLFSPMASLTVTPFHWCTLDSLRPNKPCDIVYASDGLTLLPDEDVPWLLEEIFSLAAQLVYVTIHDEKLLSEIPSYLESHTRDFQWWATQFQAISTRYPTIHWTLVFHTTNRQGKPSTIVRHGGRWLTSPPRIWILSDGKMGHATQSEGLAKSLGWPYEIKQLHFHTWNNTQKLLWSLLPPHILGLKKTQSSSLEPPWPDVVISTGWRPAPIARWIREQNGGKTRIIQLGRKGGGSADLFDVVITPAYYGFPPHPHRIETLAPLNEVTQENLDKVSQRWPNLFKNAPHPRILLVVGGSTARFTFTLEMANAIGNQLKDLANSCGGKIFAVTSPRTGNEVSQALKSALGPEHHFHQWQPHQSDNPYLAYLAGADVIIVTGESESMLAEAASLGKPVYIIPLSENPPTLKTRLSEAIVQRAQSRPLNKRGTVRPQQGLERLCAQLIRSGLIQPRRNLSLLHDSLIRQGIARPFGEPIENGKRPQLRETERVARKIKEILGIFDHENVSP